MPKIPSYFCEACGTKVDKMASSCPTCGKLFDSIKCPMCSYTGKAHEFPNGCPKCGFMNDEQKAAYKEKILKKNAKNAISKEEAQLYKILIIISCIVFILLTAAVIMMMK